MLRNGRMNGRVSVVLNEWILFGSKRLIPRISEFNYHGYLKPRIGIPSIHCKYGKPHNENKSSLFAGAHMGYERKHFEYVACIFSEAGHEWTQNHWCLFNERPQQTTRKKQNKFVLKGWWAYELWTLDKHNIVCISPEGDNERQENLRVCSYQSLRQNTQRQPVGSWRTEVQLPREGGTEMNSAAKRQPKFILEIVGWHGTTRRSDA